ncbi:MAG TPA: hypothetical protein VMM58_12780 [Bacteroidota bacterium]|nr:hypothetical protein [Bacteroidota bacterium]
MAPRVDSLMLKGLVFPGPQNTLSHPSLVVPTRPSDVAITEDFPKTFLGYALLSEPVVPKKRLDLSWKMGLGRKDDDPLGSVRMMLGVASAGGAAYMAYQHIRKYGFLK